MRTFDMLLTLSVPDKSDATPADAADCVRGLLEARGAFDAVRVEQERETTGQHWLDGISDDLEMLTRALRADNLDHLTVLASQLRAAVDVEREKQKALKG